MQWAWGWSLVLQEGEEGHCPQPLPALQGGQLHQAHTLQHLSPQLAQQLTGCPHGSWREAWCEAPTAWLPQGSGRKELAWQQGPHLATRGLATGPLQSVKTLIDLSRREPLPPGPPSPLVLSPLHSRDTLTASSQQIVHDNNFLPWLQGISLDFQLGLQMGSRHMVHSGQRLGADGPSAPVPTHPAISWLCEPGPAPQPL